MPAPLKLETVKQYITNHGDTLLSDHYDNNQQLLSIKCGKCDQIYNQAFVRFKCGFQHNQTKCPMAIKKPRKPRKPHKPYKPRKRTLQEIICPTCKKKFQPKYATRKYCSRSCSVKERKGDPRWKIFGRQGGLIANTLQITRSKNEIYFAELCEKTFESIETNSPI